jgi:hypothetical protein
LEIYAVELETKSSKLIVLSLYRAPTGNFNQVIKNVDDDLKHLYKLVAEAELLICGDIKTDYLIESNRKRQLASLLAIYTLLHTVNFATRIQNNSSTVIDNIFVDDSRINLSSLSPIVNGLSKHNA